MGFRLKTHFAAGLLFLIAWCQLSAQTISQDTPAITVFVYNAAHVSPSDLAQSEKEASLIFRDAGIATEWITCSGSVAEVCRRPLEPRQVVVQIVPKGKTSTDAVLGVAFLGAGGIGKYSDVFFNRIEQMHDGSGASIDRLLGAVAAHEVGHLLLGSNSHSTTGIMSARWKKEELERVSMGCLRFSPEQASRMRAHVNAEQDGMEVADNPQLTAAGTK